MRDPVRWLALAACFLLLPSAPDASDNHTASSPLFDSDRVFEVRIEAPLDVIVSERPVDEYVSGMLSYSSGDGEAVELDMGIRARGNYRRRPTVCPFPPLRLNFKKSQVEGTLFAGQNKLKLVTHCTAGSYLYEQALVAEFLAYRILNVLTDTSFRVRLIRIEYASTDNEDSFRGYGILIEHEDSVARRIGIPPLSIEKTSLANLDRGYLNLTSVFQYMIGNTDFSPIAGSTGEECCHNYTLFGDDDHPYVSIPYDFDLSGFVDAPYASPNPKLRLKSVKERLYRGRCLNNDVVPDTIEHFRARRQEIEAVVRGQPGLSQRKQRDLLGYINGFYRSVSSPRAIDRNLLRDCK